MLIGKAPTFEACSSLVESNNLIDEAAGVMSEVPFGLFSMRYFVNA